MVAGHVGIDLSVVCALCVCACVVCACVCASVCVCLCTACVYTYVGVCMYTAIVMFVCTAPLVSHRRCPQEGCSSAFMSRQHLQRHVRRHEIGENHVLLHVCNLMQLQNWVSDVLFGAVQFIWLQYWTSWSTLTAFDCAHLPCCMHRYCRCCTCYECMLCLVTLIQ